MTGNYRCTYWLEDNGAECGKRFSDVKALRTHAKSHRERPCRFCGRMVSVNGHTQHETACDEQPEAFPWQVWDDLLADFMSHAADIEPDLMLCITTSRGALLMRRPAALAVANELLETEPVILVPSVLLSAPDTPARWRRRDPSDPLQDHESDDIDDRTNSPSPGPGDLLAGFDFGAIP